MKLFSHFTTPRPAAVAQLVRRTRGAHEAQSRYRPQAPGVGRAEPAGQPLTAFSGTFDNTPAVVVEHQMSRRAVFRLEKDRPVIVRAAAGEQIPEGDSDFYGFVVRVDACHDRDPIKTPATFAEIAGDYLPVLDAQEHVIVEARNL